MVLLLLFLCVIKNKIDNLFCFSKDNYVFKNKLENLSEGYDERWDINTKDKIKLDPYKVNITDEDIVKFNINNYNYDLLQHLQNNQHSILKKLHYVKEYEKYNLNCKLLGNLLSAGLKNEFEDFNNL